MKLIDLNLKEGDHLRREGWANSGLHLEYKNGELRYIEAHQYSLTYKDAVADDWLLFRKDLNDNDFIQIKGTVYLYYKGRFFIESAVVPTTAYQQIKHV